ncbi:MAG: hypothetical protein L6R42_006081 [Xanthoria sp. 1 TBL-2021]|nr:MAG: hypothetical protein L6R42_006081 [Xanthoria sp. 1 TBL-2021]
MVCSACKDIPDGAGNLIALYYCSAACQKANWSAHKPECQASQNRRAVYRAGIIVQTLSFTFRRNTWSWPIKKAERDRSDGIGEIWRIFDTQHPGNEVSYFLPFPKELFPNVQDQEAVLSHSDCRNAIADMEILIKDLLQGESRISYVRQPIKVG